MGNQVFALMRSYPSGRDPSPCSEFVRYVYASSKSLSDTIILVIVGST